MDCRILQIRPRTENKSQRLKSLSSLLRHQTLNFPVLTLLHKPLNGTRIAIADRVVLKLTNTELLAASTQKKKINELSVLAFYTVIKEPRVLSPEDVGKR